MEEELKTNTDEKQEEKKRGRKKLEDMTEAEKAEYLKNKELRKLQKEKEQKEKEAREAKEQEYCDVLLPLTFKEFNIFKEKCNQIGIETDLCLKLLIEGFVKDKFQFEVARKFYLPDEKPQAENVLMSVMGLNDK